MLGALPLFSFSFFLYQVSRKGRSLSELVDKEDWEALIGVLGDTIKKLEGKQVEPVKLGILEFVSTAAMLGLQDLADVSKGFENFLLQTIAPAWDAEAVATLGFSMGALAEKMQLQEYGPKFSSGLGEITLYLEMYTNEETGPDSQPQFEAETAAPSFAQEDTLTFSTDDDDLNSLLSDTHLLEDLPSFLPESAFEAEFTALEPESAPIAPGAVERDGTESLDALSIPGDFEMPDESPAVQEVGASISAGIQEAIQPKAEPQSADSLEREPLRASRDMGFVMDKLDWYRQTLRNDPTSQAFVSLAEELCFRNQWREAVETCRRGLAIHPYLTRGRVLMGWALWELGKLGESERMLREAKSDLEVNGILYKILGEIAASRGDTKGAEHYMHIFQSLLPEGAEGLSLRAIPRTFEEQPQPQAPSLVEFLTTLLHKFEDKRPKRIAQRSFFSDADREALRRLLTTTMH